MKSPQGRRSIFRGRQQRGTLHERLPGERKLSEGITGNAIERSSARQPQPRLRAAASLVAALMGLGGFVQAEAFLLSATPRLGRALTTRSLESSLSRVSGFSTRRSCAMLMTVDEGDVEAVRARSVPDSEMATETNEIKPPPDRDAALRMIEERAAEELERGELGPYAQADIPDLPKPPYYFMAPGEFGNDTLCTDPGWHTALLALKWLGMPFEIRHEEEDDREEEGPILIMGDEVYDDPREVVSGLPERALLSDFVESFPNVTKVVEKLEPAWRAVHYNDHPKTARKLEKTLESTLQEIENTLARKSYSGVLLEGEELTVGDLTLGVTTFHMLAAFASGNPWKFPDKFVNLKMHMEEMHNMQIFQMVVPSADILAKKYAVPS